jgi:hypothetical protein
MNYFRSLVFALFILSPLTAALAQEAGDWHEKTLLLVYSPRYFGPSAFPIPELRTGKAPLRYEVEVRGQYHYYAGDRTGDIFARALLPLVKGRAGVEVSFLAFEKYKLTPETRDERHAIETECPPDIKYNGDVVVSAFFQLLESEKWLDAMVSLNLKTASGGRLCDARFTDAATYWMDLTAGKDLMKSYDEVYFLRMQALVGFYCWMTNDIVRRQNDAISFGIGLTGGLDKLTLSTDLSGFRGYDNNGDRPLVLRNNLQFEFMNNVISLRYNHGMQDSLYDTYSLGYIRRF